MGRLSPPSLIIVLLFWGGPTTILWFVVPVVVYSVERRAVWPLAHIVEEVLE